MAREDVVPKVLGICLQPGQFDNRQSVQVELTIEVPSSERHSRAHQASNQRCRRDNCDTLVSPTNPDGSAKEKRGVVMLTRDKWEDWLACRNPEVARSFLTLYAAELMDAAPAPVERKAVKQPPKSPPTNGDLF